MIKKISALLLALVICVTAVVMPVSALESGKTVGYRIDIDADGYKAGSKVTVKLYMEFAEDKEWGAGAIMFAMNNIFVESQAGDKAAATTVQSSATYNDVYTSTYKVGANATWGWMTDTVAGKIATGNTLEGESAYEKYLKLTVAKNSAGTHKYCASTKNGLTGAELNADTKPFVTFQLTLAQDLKEGQKIVIGIPSGSLNGSYSYMQYYENPGNATTQSKQQVAACDLTEALVVAEGSILTPLKGQMRYNLDDKSKFDVRALAVISGADFAAKFTDVATAKGMIKEAGFVFAAGSNVDKPSMAAVKALVENGTAVAGYSKATVDYISTSISSGNYAFSCIVKGVNETDAQTNRLIAVGYIAWDSNADGTVDSYAYYPAAQTIEFAKLYANKK